MFSALSRYRSLCDLRSNKASNATQIPQLQARKKTSSIGRLASSRSDLHAIAESAKTERLPAANRRSATSANTSASSSHANNYMSFSLSSTNLSNCNDQAAFQNGGRLTRSISTDRCGLCCSQSKEKVRKAFRHEKKTDFRTRKGSMRDANDSENSSSCERYSPSMESYKQLMKENLQLQASFKLIYQRLEHAKEKLSTDDQEKLLLRDQVDRLKKKVDSMSRELREFREQNELMEFRILEMEEDQAMLSSPPSTSSSPSSNSHDAANNHMDSGKLACCKETATKSKSCSSLESYTLTLSLTSEDEGLGDDGRRDQFSGPSSLSGLPLSSDEEQQTPEDRQSQLQSSSHEKAFRESKCSGEKVDSTQDGRRSPVFCQGCSKTCSMEKEITILMEDRENLREQVLELEEAENDARLVSQKLERQVENLMAQIEHLQVTLSKANQQIEANNETIKSLQEEELKLKVDFMMALISKHEESPEQLLEDLKAKLKEKRSELDQLHPLFNRMHSGDKSSEFRRSASRSGSHPSLHYSHHSDANDCEIFIPEDSLPPNLGSSFHVKNFENRFKRSRSSLSSASIQKPAAMPICETVKPKKIDLMVPESGNP